MRCYSFLIFMCLLWSTTVKCNNVENGFEESPILDLGTIINQTLESLRPSLANLEIKSQSFSSGAQEFGNIDGNVRDVMVEGLDKFNVKIIKTWLLDVNNLTIVNCFTAKGFYNLNGTLAFPLGKNDIAFFGSGEFRKYIGYNGHTTEKVHVSAFHVQMCPVLNPIVDPKYKTRDITYWAVFSAKFTNFSVSVKLKIRIDNDKKIVRDLDILVGLDKFQVYFKNLMGGGDLEKTFNRLTNDVGLTIFNYYKTPILNAVKPKIIKIITDMLNKSDVTSA